MASIFTKIVKGEIPSYKIIETDKCLAFLDVFPLVEGHVLVIPKQEVDDLFDVDNELYTELMLLSKRVSKAVKEAYPCIKVGVSVIGLEVPHAHIHLIPLNEVADMNFSKEKLKLTKSQLEESAKKIKNFL